MKKSESLSEDIMRPPACQESSLKGESLIPMREIYLIIMRLWGWIFR